MDSFFKLSNNFLNPSYNPLSCSSVRLLFTVFLSISVISFALAITSSAYRLPSPFLASVLTTSLSLLFSNNSVNSFSEMFIGFIPLSSGKTYSLLELMSLLLQCFLLRGKMILFSSSKRMIFPLSNNSTIIV